MSKKSPFADFLHAVEDIKRQKSKKVTHEDFWGKAPPEPGCGLNMLRPNSAELIEWLMDKPVYQASKTLIDPTAVWRDEEWCGVGDEWVISGLIETVYNLKLQVINANKKLDPKKSTVRYLNRNCNMEYLLRMITVNSVLYQVDIPENMFLWDELTEHTLANLLVAMDPFAMTNQLFQVSTPYCRMDELQSQLASTLTSALLGDKGSFIYQQKRLPTPQVLVAQFHIGMLPGSVDGKHLLSAAILANEFDPRKQVNINDWIEIPIRAAVTRACAAVSRHIPSRLFICDKIAHKLLDNS